jgi:hypothetical protein
MNSEEAVRRVNEYLMRRKEEALPTLVEVVLKNDERVISFTSGKIGVEHWVLTYKIHDAPDWIDEFLVVLVDAETGEVFIPPVL